MDNLNVSELNVIIIDNELLMVKLVNLRVPYQVGKILYLIVLPTKFKI